MQFVETPPNTFPLGWGRVKTLGLSHLPVFSLELILVVAWRLQSKAAWVALLATVRWVGILQALAIMLIWGLVAVQLYEWIRRRGIPDPIHLPQGESKGRWKKTLAWGFYVFKAGFLGWKQFVYAAVFDRLIISDNRKGLPRLAKGSAIFGGVCLFGVTAAHHTLSMAGCSRSQIFWGNMAGRLVEAGMKLLKVTLLLSFPPVVLVLLPIL